MSATNSGDTAWLLISTALVLLMMPGLALFYGGLVRTKNVLSTFMHSFVVLGLVTLQWVRVRLLAGVRPGPRRHHRRPVLRVHARRGFGAAAGRQHPAHAVLRLSDDVRHHHAGAHLGRLSPSASSSRPTRSSRCCGRRFVYDPLAHWVWGDGGWLGKLGVLDFAGGIVVHISSGVVGPGGRAGGRQAPRAIRASAAVPHNLTMVLLGAGLLWFGWFGFNGGSARLGVGHRASLALVNSQLPRPRPAAWPGCSSTSFATARPRRSGFASGSSPGSPRSRRPPASWGRWPRSSSASSPACGCYGARLLKGASRLRRHARCLRRARRGRRGRHHPARACSRPRPGTRPARTGCLHGEAALLRQAAPGRGGAPRSSTSVAAPFVILKLVDALVGLRVTADEEREGLDINLHGEEGYAIGATSQGHSGPNL